MTRARFLLVVALLVPTALTCAGSAQSPGTHPVTGRRFAEVMSHRGAPWLDRAERDREENTTRAIELLEVTPGMTVVDFGAGSGYYTERLARKVGPTGKVIAVDIQPEMLDLLRARAARLGLKTSSSCAARWTTRGCPPARWTSSSWWTSTTSCRSRRPSCAA